MSKFFTRIIFKNTSLGEADLYVSTSALSAGYKGASKQVSSGQVLFIFEDC